MVQVRADTSTLHGGAALNDLGADISATRFLIATAFHHPLSRLLAFVFEKAGCDQVSANAGNMRRMISTAAPGRGAPLKRPSQRATERE